MPRTEMDIKTAEKLSFLFVDGKHDINPKHLLVLEQILQKESPIDQKPYGLELAISMKDLGFRLSPYIELLLSELNLNSYDISRLGNGVLRASMWILKYAKFPIGSKRREEIFRNGYANAARWNRNKIPTLAEIELPHDETLQLIPDIYHEYTEHNLSPLLKLPNLVTLPANKLLAQMIVDLFYPTQQVKNSMRVDTDLEIGSCSDVETIFQNILDKKPPYFDTNNAIITIFTNDDEPILIEKTAGRGERFSSISLVDLNINGVTIPAGTLIATSHSPAAIISRNYNNELASNIFVKRISGLDGINPVRLSVFSLPSSERSTAFCSFLANRVSADLSDLQKFAYQYC